jgi:hypothetical protein
MLILSRKLGESIVIDGRIHVTVMRVEGEVVKLGIAAPSEVQSGGFDQAEYAAAQAGRGAAQAESQRCGAAKRAALKVFCIRAGCRMQDKCPVITSAPNHGGRDYWLLPRAGPQGPARSLKLRRKLCVIVFGTRLGNKLGE